MNLIEVPPLWLTALIGGIAAFGWLVMHMIDKKIKEKLNKFMGVVDVEDVAEINPVSSETNPDSSETNPDSSDISPEDELQQPKPDAV